MRSYDLFGEPVKPKRKTTVPRGHAAPIGSGPDGEKCKTCEHYVIRRFAGSFKKCGLMELVWTKGTVMDIRANDDACSKWEVMKIG